MTGTAALDQARAVADAVLFEGYLLYPYRATARKNQVRWQFGVLGPPGALEAGAGEPATMSADCLLRDDGAAAVTIHLRFLHLQTRSAERVTGSRFDQVDELEVGDRRWLTWDEAVQVERVLGPVVVGALSAPQSLPVSISGGTDVELVRDPDGTVAGRLVRRRRPLTATITVGTNRLGGSLRLSVALANTGPAAADEGASIAHSFIGAHALLELSGGAFVSTVDPPADARLAADSCRQDRWWPALAGPPGQSSLLLLAPIILEDHAEIAPESTGALFDSTEIDEILTLRVMTMTDDEKAEARATDPRAAEIVDRCDSMTPDQLQRLHGALRSPHDPTNAADALSSTQPAWWDPEADRSIAPDRDVVVIDGAEIGRSCLVTLRPRRRADAHDMFFAGMTGRVAAVFSDVDGDTHVAVTLVDDPAAEMHDWYGRYLYFAPDELEPLPVRAAEPDTTGGSST